MWLYFCATISLLICPVMKKQLPILFFFGFILLLFNQHLSAQGCVAIRPMSGCAGTASSSILLGKGQWQLGANYRYFRSFRHFKSDTEQKERLENDTEVINWAVGRCISLNCVVY